MEYWEIFFISKTKKQGKITLAEKYEIVHDDKKTFLIEFFANAVPYLNIPEFTRIFDQSGAVVSACPIINATTEYENHLGVTKIRNKLASSVNFSLNLV